LRIAETGRARGGKIRIRNLSARVDHAASINVWTNYTNNVALTDIDFPKVDVEQRPAA
jgi:hypothetical protein